MKGRRRHPAGGNVTLPGDAAQQSGNPVGPGDELLPGGVIQQGDNPLPGDTTRQGGPVFGSSPVATANSQTSDLHGILHGLEALGLGGDGIDGGDVPAAAAAGARSVGAGNIPATLAQDLHRYVKELKLWNPRLGLIEATEAEILPKHIWDSLAGVLVFRAVTENLGSTRLGSAGGETQSLVVADLGSGAGLPGLVLSLAIPQTSQGVSLRWVLVEKSGRRVNFLRNCKALIPRAPIEIDPSSFEDIPAESFDVVTNRAFQPLSLSTFAQQSRLVREGGWILWYKGKFDAVVDEGHALGRKVRVVTSLKEALELDFGTELGAWPLEVPGLNAQRHILMWKKAQTQN